MSLAIYLADEFEREKAGVLAKLLDLPLTDEASAYPYVITYTHGKLGVLNTQAPSLPVYVDFLSSSLNYRRQHTSLRQEMLARAMGLKLNQQPRIIDATAGFAKDSFILAALGFEVLLIERSKVMHALLEDGIRRGLQDKSIAHIIKRLTLLNADAISWLHSRNNEAEIVYLDPMFPASNKSALAKKEMRWLHDIVGNDEDADILLPHALTCATKRVVVKRPRLAPCLANKLPSYSLTGSSNRFDIYLR